MAPWNCTKCGEAGNADSELQCITCGESQPLADTSLPPPPEDYSEGERIAARLSGRPAPTWHLPMPSAPRPRTTKKEGLGKRVSGRINQGFDYVYKKIGPRFESFAEKVASKAGTVSDDEFKEFARDLSSSIKGTVRHPIGTAKAALGILEEVREHEIKEGHESASGLTYSILRHPVGFGSTVQYVRQETERGTRERQAEEAYMNRLRREAGTGDESERQSQGQQYQTQQSQGQPGQAPAQGAAAAQPQTQEENKKKSEEPRSEKEKRLEDLAKEVEETEAKLPGMKDGPKIESDAKPKEIVRWSIPSYDLDEICGKPVKTRSQPGYNLNLYNVSKTIEIDLTDDVKGTKYRGLAKYVGRNLAGFLDRKGKDIKDPKGGYEIECDIGGSAWVNKYNRKAKVKAADGKLIVTYQAKEAPKSVIEKDIDNIYDTLLGRVNLYVPDEQKKEEKKADGEAKADAKAKKANGNGKGKPSAQSQEEFAKGYDSWMKQGKEKGYAQVLDQKIQQYVAAQAKGAEA